MSSANARRLLAPLHGAVLLFALASTATVSSCGRSEPRSPELLKRPDIWVSSITLDSDSRARYIGKTKDYLITTASEVKELKAPPHTISVGDSLEGIRVGAIRCSFHWKDASYGREQYMWRGRWDCMIGRSKQEIEDAVGPDGEKRFDYLSVAPVSVRP